MMKKKRSSAISTGAMRALFCTVALGVPIGATADEFAASVSAGVGHSDNIMQSEADKVDETMGIVGLNLGYEGESRRLEAEVFANVGYVEYLDDTFDSEVIGNAAASAVFAIAPERFLWAVEDYFGQVRRDVFSAPGPGNRENVNFFSTGPDFIMNLGSRNSMRLSGRYSRQDYEESELSSTSNMVSLAFARRLSEAASIALVGDVTEYNFEDASESDDYERRSAYVSYQLGSDRTTLDLSVGYNIVDQGSTDREGLLARLRLTRRVSPSSWVWIGGGTGFPDSREVFASSQMSLSARDDTQPLVASSEASEQEYLDAGWQFTRNRTSMNLVLMMSREKYQRQTAFNRELLITDAEIERQMGRRLTFLLGARFEKEDFEEGFNAETLEAEAGLNWRLSRNAFLTMRLVHADRDSSATTTEYQETQGWLILSYGQGADGNIRLGRR